MSWSSLGSASLELAERFCLLKTLSREFSKDCFQFGLSVANDGLDVDVLASRCSIELALKSTVSSVWLKTFSFWKLYAWFVPFTQNNTCRGSKSEVRARRTITTDYLFLNDNMKDCRVLACSNGLILRLYKTFNCCWVCNQLACIEQFRLIFGT